jgi:hypothetical protein
VQQIAFFKKKMQWFKNMNEQNGSRLVNDGEYKYVSFADIPGMGHDRTPRPRSGAIMVIGAVLIGAIVAVVLELKDNDI